MQESSADSTACDAFREYYAQRQKRAAGAGRQFSTNLDELQEDRSQLEATVQEQHDLLEELETDIDAMDESIAQIEANISQLETDITAREEEIERWDTQIKARMLSEQASVGTNQVVDMIMNSGSLEEMMRTLEGLQRITGERQRADRIAGDGEGRAAAAANEQSRLQETARHSGSSFRSSAASRRSCWMQMRS